MFKYNLPIEYSRLEQWERKLVREQYVREQDGKCYWCNEPLDGDLSKENKNKKINWKLFPPNFLKYPVHLQHDHGTDLTEGAVHAKCNAVMWQYYGR